VAYETIGTATAAGGTVPKGFVDIPEQRFPLNLTAHIPGVAAIWQSAKASSWDARRDIAYDQFDRSAYSEEQLWAGRVFWSRRAWSEYTGLAESPCVLLRFAFQGPRESEVKFVLASKLMDEAKHCEASYLMAEAMGGYIPEPPAEAPRRRVMSGLRDVGMEPTYCPEAVIAGWHCVSEGVAVDIFRARVEHTSNPVVKDVLGRILTDELRHINVGWAYLDWKLPRVSDAVRENVRVAMQDVIENIELAGFHSSSTFGDNEPDYFARLDTTCAEAGLGAAPAQMEHEWVQRSLREIWLRARKWGIELPQYDFV
jgi:hypothetical protein